ncbi:hypothetical protein ALC60_11077 [Trachymyrmex zeteki]|uniref:Uncharacterized protein n=1 Tax=Mycetomoellerius zeteki TaxID=64791 RepID=A0A151WPS5_9HYME|nr:hypothetical protein ALC60_11077 [Trachymyrmex zeteki]
MHTVYCSSTDAPFDRHRGGEGHTEEGRNDYKERVKVVRLYASLDYTGIPPLSFGGRKH